MQSPFNPSTLKEKLEVRIVIVVGIIFLVVLFFHSIGQNDNAAFIADLNTAAALQAQWLINNQLPEGDLVYERYVSTGEVKPGINIVRETGVFYQLAFYYTLHPSTALKQMLEKGFQFFEKNSDTMTVTVDGNQLDGSRLDYDGQSFNNASALLLVGLVNYMETSPQIKSEYFSYAESLTNYLVSTQQADGGFLYQDGSLLEDDYNNGESFYALTRMYQFDRNPLYLAAAQKSAEHYMVSYGVRDVNYSFYHWGMQGFYYLYQTSPDERYWQFMKMYTQEFMNEQGNMTEQFLHNHGSVAPSSGTPAYLEGVIHVAALAKEKDPVWSVELQDYAADSLKYLFSLQVDGPHSERTSPYELVKGGVCIDYYCETERIDETGHNLSAIDFYLTLLNPGT